MYPNPTADLLSGFLQPSAETEFTTDKWGTTLSGFAPIRDSGGRVVGLVGVDMDSQRVIGRMQFVSMITYALLIIILILVSIGTILFDIRRTRAEILIGSANEKLNILNSIIRHDISNTLTALIGYEDMAKETTTMPEVQEKLTTIAMLTQKIQHQITFTRDYQDLGLSQPEWQNVQDIITREASGFDFSSGTIALDFANLEIYADPLIKRGFHHLLDNAIRYGRAGTKIHGHYQRSGSNIILIIEDDGIGIPENEKEGIFKREYYKNTGLGLFLVQEILSMTDLSIRETGIPGKGARFEIMVPKGKYRFL
jgi:signal transduction histidine kinase